MGDKLARLKAKWLRPQTFILLLVAALVGALYWFFGCPVKYVTGLSCPGCGITRAWLAAITLHFGEAFRLHPLFLLVLPGLWLMLSKWGKTHSRLRNVLLGVICAAFIVVYLVRLFWLNDPVVNWSTPGIVQDFTSGFSRFGLATSTSFSAE